MLDVTANDPQNEQEFRHQDLKQAAQERLLCHVTRPSISRRIGDARLKAAAEARVEEKSAWFRLRTNIRIGTAEFVLYSVLFRDDSNKVRTVQRSFGSE